MKKPHLLFFICLALLALGCSGKKATNETVITTSSVNVAGQGQAAVADDTSQPNILNIAISSNDHSTLVAGVKAAGLEHVLANNGPLTVFAPTNSAFDKLPEGTLDNLLKPENKSTLAGIITYHAAPGTYAIDDLKDGMELYQATGANVIIKKLDGKVTVNGAEILASVVASNGIVHVIDQVLLPPQ